MSVRTTITVPCPYCDAPVTVGAEITGRSRPATYWDDGEWPELWLDPWPATCPGCGIEYDDSDLGSLDREVGRYQIAP
ncbi:MAG TPA: hypothetical protein VFQ22_07730 [Longimicrobiales bacterium]|nr:hypothetical protein [Longimicrobiales bacterium]